MTGAISHPAVDEHIAPCGLFCSNCGRLRKGRCAGCQVQAGFARCGIRACVVEKGIVTCAECDEFGDGRPYTECSKLNNFISKIFGLLFRSDRIGDLRMLREQGREAYLEYKRAE